MSRWHAQHTNRRGWSRILGFEVSVPHLLLSLGHQLGPPVRHPSWTGAKEAGICTGSAAYIRL